MKHFHNFKDYNIVKEQIEQLKKIETIEQLHLYETQLDTLELNEGIFKYIKKKVKQVKDFFSDSEKAIEYVLTGDDPDEERAPKEYDEEILLIYNEPTGNGKDVYMIHNGDDATDHKFDYSKLFFSFQIAPELLGDLKDTPSVKVSSIYDKTTRKKTEYAIALYSLLDELEVDHDLYGHGHIEEVTPSVFIYLRHLKPGYEQRLKKYYKQLLKLPKFYDKKIHSNFDEKVLIKALNSVKLDMKRNK
jgi:hypothetical protein